MIMKTARKCPALAHSASLHLRRKGADQHASMLTESPLLVMVEKYDSEGDSFVFQNDWQNRLYWGQGHRAWEGSLWRTTAERNSLCWWIFLAFCTVIPAAFLTYSLQLAHHTLIGGRTDPIFLLKTCYWKQGNTGNFEFAHWGWDQIISLFWTS